ncbi:MAG: nitroreductase [Rhodobacteraceae bacterium]|nr:nitroreductase [Paracoccaceae bacterium]
MLSPNPAALEFLLSRRSRPAKTLQAPAPSKEELTQLLTAAARTPDHGKLEPWRFIVIEQPAMARLAETVTARGEDMGMDPEKIAKGRAQFDTGILAIAVIEVQKPSDKIPAIEQTYSAGAVCLALLNAALAAGWGANWLSGWPSHDPVWRQTALGLAENERIAGLVHIATEGATPPERPRPNLEEVVTWVST